MRYSTRVSSSTLAALDCFIGLGLLGIYLKVALLGPHWNAIARFYDQSGAHQLALSHRLGFFVQDVWLNLFAAPLVGAVAVSVVAARQRSTIAALISAAVSIAYFVELQVQKEVGRYLGGDVLGDLLGWVLSTPATAFDYVTTASLVKLAGFLSGLGAVVAIDRFAVRSEESGRLRRALMCRRVLWLPAAAAAVTTLATIPLAMSTSLLPSPLTTSAVITAAATLRTSDKVADRGSTDSPHVRFRQLTQTAVFDPSNRFVGREQDSDLIIFMMETGAAKALDIAVEGRGLPGVGSLYSRAFVTTRHYTTYPYSSDALYSVFSGRYPHARRRVLRTAAAESLPGLMTNVRERATVRRVYVPSLYKVELDDRMYKALGAEQVYASDEHDDEDRLRAEARAEVVITNFERAGRLFDPRSRARLKARLRADLQALEKTKQDISAAIHANRRYVVMFFPQIGHGPWSPLNFEGSVLERGRALMLLQDTWLKEILEVVRNLRRLDRTVVAVTADHGVRTRTEDPFLPVGQISDYMFRVPLVVYAPQTLSATTTIDVPTSHIDVAPTLLALLGKTRGIDEMQGVPIWQRSAADRIYLLAFAYGGADGFVENGRYYMRQGISGATFVSDRFVFDDVSQVPLQGTVSDYVDDQFETLDLIQQSIVSRTIHNLRTCGSSDCAGPLRPLGQ